LLLHESFFFLGTIITSLFIHRLKRDITAILSSRNQTFTFWLM